jgi:uncharacterized membrane protein YedE/YeeE
MVGEGCESGTDCANGEGREKMGRNAQADGKRGRAVAPPPLAGGSGDLIIAAPRIQPVVVGIALSLITGGAVAVVANGSGRLGLLFLLGLLLGLTLYHAAFGFTSVYRKLFTQRAVSGILAQLLMLGVATLLFAPVLAAGSFLGRGVVGAVAPAGVSVFIGAFLFGLGMQLVGGCGSGTLYTMGGGSTRMVLALLSLCVGSFWASLHMWWWVSLPSLSVASLAELLGWPLAVAVQLLVFLGIALAAWRWGKGRGGRREKPKPGGWRRLLVGPWPLIAGALALAGLNFLTLLIAGHPWTITWAFTLWGAKGAALLGWDPTQSPFWGGGFPRAALESGVLSDATSVMNIAIILGALLAAALAGRFAPTYRIPLPSLAAALLGGLLMGYGARIAYGCNIGAFFSGIASTSLHGWLWIIAALAGTVVGLRLRPLFGLGR